MNHFLKMIAAEPEIARFPVMVDSSKWSAIEAGLKCLQRKGGCQFNQPERGRRGFPMKCGRDQKVWSSLVAMAFDEEGHATSLPDRVSICDRAYHLLNE